MKRMIILAGLILGFSVMTMSVSAQTATTDKAKDTKEQQAAPATKSQFTDTNKDGVCDNHQAMVKDGKCTGFTDKDKDGKCDICQCSANDCKEVCAGKGKAEMKCGGSTGCGGCGKGSGMQHGSANCPKK